MNSFPMGPPPSMFSHPTYVGRDSGRPATKGEVAGILGFGIIYLVVFFYAIWKASRS